MKCYKIRLIAKDYVQKESIDYNEIFALLAKMTSICTFLIQGTIEDLEVHQMDIKTTFLNGDLKKEIYIYGPIRMLYITK